MSRLASFLSRLRVRGSRSDDDAKKLAEARADARTHDMLDGKGLSPTGAVIDFESDAEPPRR